MSSPALKFTILSCAVLLAGCDRQSGGDAQPAASAAAAAGAGAAGPLAAGAVDRSHKGSALPEAQLKDPAGKELNLASLKGKPLMINLWATWCTPCVAELPQLDAIAGAHPELKLLTVNQDMDKLDKVAPFLKAHGVTRLEPWLNPDNSLTFQFGAETLPATIFYDADGHEAWRIVGGRDWATPETAALLAEAR